MKYYKLIGGIYPSFIKGKIYPENSHGDNAMNSVKYYACSNNNWQEVTERDYLQQELNNGKLIKGGYYVVLVLVHLVKMLLNKLLNIIKIEKND